MVQIIEEPMSFGQQFGRGLGQNVGSALAGGLEGYIQKKQNEKSNAAIKRLTGMDPSGLPPEYKQELMKQFSKMQAQQAGLTQMFPERFGRGQSSTDMGDRLQGNTELSEDSRVKGMPMGFKDMSPEERTKLAAVNPMLSKHLLEEEKLGLKKESEKSGRHFEIAKDTLLANAQRAETLPQKESALHSMVDAIQNKNLGFFTRDNLAEITGIEGLRSPEGAVFKTAGKEFFLGSLKRAGARPNQWIEKQISDMLTKVGRSTEANLSVAAALQTELDIEKKQIELTNEIADKMEKERGFVGRDLSAQVMKQLTPYAMEKQKELENNLKDIKSNYEPVSKEGKLMYDPSGNLRRIPMKEIKAARKANYTDYK